MAIVKKKVLKEINIKGYSAVLNENGLFDMTWTPKDRDKLGMTVNKETRRIGENMSAEEVSAYMLDEDFTLKQSIARDLNTDSDHINGRTMLDYINEGSIALKDKLRVNIVESEGLYQED